MNTTFKKYLQLCEDMSKCDTEVIPLCAAQTHISDFCKKALISNFEGKYSFVDKEGHNSFIGGEYVERLNKLLSEECKKLFGASYSNADTLTGINCFTVCAMSMLDRTQSVLVTTPEQGGHPSIPVILDTLGIRYHSMPYNFLKRQIDYSEVNRLLKKYIYDFLIFCQSDILDPPDLSKLVIPPDSGIIYDCTQTLGLIAGKVLENPLMYKNCILLGGAHKTLPAPSCGLIMTNTDTYADKLKEFITPHFLRNTQPNHIASLLLSLIEQEKYGEQYQTKTVAIANSLGEKLEEIGFNVAKINDKTFSRTHQLFILMNKNETDKFFYNAQKYNVSLNKKHKKLFNESGIRLGTQHIARYNWAEEEIIALSQLLHYIFLGDKYKDEILKIRSWLIQRKIPCFEYSGIIIE